MKKNKFIIILSMVLFAFTSCKTLEVIEDIAETTLNSEDAMEAIRKTREEITPENEYYIGRAVAATILSQYEVYENPSITNYLNKICGALTINSDKPYLYKGYNVTILESDELNAMATSGGHIFVTTGILKCVESEDEIAAILAHEVSHIQLSHSATAIKGDRYTKMILEIGKANINANIKESEFYTKEELESFSNSVLNFTDTLMNSGFSQVQEFEADENAIVLMQKAGYNPNKLTSMLELINTVDNKNGGWYRTHPSPKDRIKAVKKSLKSMNSNFDFFVAQEMAGFELRTNRFNQIMQSL